MDAILDIFRSFSDDPQTVRLLVMGAAAISLAIFGLGIAYIFTGATDPVRRRLNEVTDADGSVHAGGVRKVTFTTLTGPIAKFVIPKESADQSETVQKLIYADLYSPNAVQNYYAIRALMLLGLPGGFWFLSQWLPNLSNNMVLMYAACAAAVGYIGPSYILDRLIDIRQTKLRRGFPDALDLMVVCVESGLGLAQSLQRVSEELMVSHPELSEELALVTAEMRAGVENVVALKNLSARTGLDDIRGLVSTLVQTLRFGTGVADALRVYSEEARDKRTQAAEERAAKMGTKMIFPLIFFMFPAFFVVAIGPAVIQLINTFQKLN